MGKFDPQNLMTPHSTTDVKHTPERKVTPNNKPRKFLKGPIPLYWLIAASKLPGKALAVGVVIWFRAGLEKSHQRAGPARR